MATAKSLYFVWQEPKARYRASLHIACIVTSAVSRAAALRQARTMPIFAVDYPGDYKRLQVRPIRECEGFYV